MKSGGRSAVTLRKTVPGRTAGVKVLRHCVPRYLGSSQEANGVGDRDQDLWMILERGFYSTA